VQVIDFLYTGSILLSLNDVTDVLRLADFLRIDRLLELCSKHLSACVNSSNAIVIRHLVDTYNLTAVAPHLANTVSSIVSQHLSDIMRSLRRSRRLCRQLPFEVISRLLNDVEIGSVREQDVYHFVCHYASVNDDPKTESRPDEDRASSNISSDSNWNLLDFVEFDYLPTTFVCNSVLTNAAVIEWLQRSKPETLRYLELRQQMTSVSTRDVVNIIVCRSRSVKAFDRNPVQLIVYDITNDSWSYLHSSALHRVGSSQLSTQARLGNSTADFDEYSLDGLESMVVVGGTWLYVLCSTSDDSYCHAERPVEKKRFWCYNLQCDSSSWIELAMPVVVQSRCRLVADDQEFIYAVDREARVERYSITDGRWTVLCRVGFTSFAHATLYVLPIPVSAETPLLGGRRHGLYIVRLFSSGYSFYFTSTSVAIYRLDTSVEDHVMLPSLDPSTASNMLTTSVSNEWEVLERSEIELVDLITDGDDRATSASIVHFHGYTLKPGRIELTDDLGRPRVSFDLIARDWLPVAVTAAQRSVMKVPRFVGSILASAAHAGRTYCATRVTDAVGRFVMYDHGHCQYKALSLPPVPLSGVMCRATIPRSALERLVQCKTDPDIDIAEDHNTSDMEFDT